MLRYLKNCLQFVGRSWFAERADTESEAGTLRKNNSD